MLGTRAYSVSRGHVASSEYRSSSMLHPDKIALAL
jgi:hypothetical protein